jgi:hypothetical protein
MIAQGFYQPKKSALPQIMIPEMRSHIHNQVKTMIGYQLAYIKIRPSKIESLASIVANKTNRSFFQPGNPIGFAISEAIGQPATQLMLSSFHKAGQAGASGFNRLKAAINPKNIKTLNKWAKTTTMNIHMRNKEYSYEDLYIAAYQFISVTIADLIDNSRITKETYPFEDKSMYIPEFTQLSNYKDLGCGIRLRFNREKLFLHKISLDSIAKKLEEIAGGNLFTVFCGPHIEGVIDIYPNPSSICTSEVKDLQECCDVFENGHLKTEFSSKSLNEDYADISKVSVKRFEVVKLIQAVTPHFEINEAESETVSETVSDSLVRVWIKWVVAKKEGIPIEKLESLLELSGFPIAETDPDGFYYVVASPGGSLKVVEEISQLMKDETQRLIASFSETNILTSSELYIAGNYCNIFTMGSNLAKVRLHPDVDEFNTISDSVSEIYKVLGLEVARAYVIKELNDIFEDIAPRNIEILADWMTASGRIIPVNVKSIPKNESSVIRSMCFENPKIHIVHGAVTGVEELVSNVSSRVLFGVQQSIGTGAFQIKEDPEIVKMYESFRGGSKSSIRGSNLRLTPKTLKMSSGFKIPEAAAGLFGDDEVVEGSEKGSLVLDIDETDL